MKVLLAGASGVIGRRLTPMLTALGYDIVGLSRTAEGASRVASLGTRGLVCDALDAERLHAVLIAERPDVVINQMTSLPAAIDVRRIDRDFAATNRLREEGTRHLVSASRAAGVRRLIAQSVAFAYAPEGGAVKDENAPLALDAPHPWRASVLAVAAHETSVLEASELEGVILRYGFFYGPDTAYGRTGAVAARVREGGFPIAGSGSGVWSFIHIDDAAAATMLAVKGPKGIYNICDDEPAPLAEWLPHYAREIGAPAPKKIPLVVARLLGGWYATYLAGKLRGASNARARRELGFEPRYSSWRQGFADL